MTDTLKPTLWRRCERCSGEALSIPSEYHAACPVCCGRGPSPYFCGLVAVPSSALLIEDGETLRDLIEMLAVLEVVPWTAKDDETAGVMAHRLAVRVLLELANPGDGYDGAKVRAALGTDTEHTC